MPRKIKKYGWTPPLPDHRDIWYRSPRHLSTSLPDEVDLQPQCPPVYDQGELGSCTANASAGMAEFLIKKYHQVDFTPSRLFIYYEERTLEGTVGTDSGASLRDGIKVMASEGCPHETLWPYTDIEKRFTERPSADAYADGLKHIVYNYSRLDNTNLTDLQAVLAEGFPFIFGFTVYPSFESAEVAKTGIVPMPGKNEAPLGGHAVCAVSYSNGRQAFLVRNSWGATWALNGYFWLPYAYITDPTLADDFWVAKQIKLIATITLRSTS